MKKLILATISGVIALAASQSVLSQESYVATLNEDGEYCAKVRIQTIGSSYITRLKCRTLDQWEEMGYVVSAKED